MEKNRLKKCENTFFINTLQCDQKWGEKLEKKIFPETQISQAYNDGKNRLEKVRKHVFYKHTNIVAKKLEKKTRENFFSKNTRISQAKNDGKNRLEKVRKYVFYKHTNIVTKNRGKKNREKNFQKTQEKGIQKLLEKNRQEKV